VTTILNFEIKQMQDLPAQLDRDMTAEAMQVYAMAPAWLQALGLGKRRNNTEVFGEIAVAPHPSRLLRSFSRKSKPTRTHGTWAQRQSSDADGVKMVLVVRTDAGMSTGKVASQAAHGALAVYKLACEGRRSSLCREWDVSGAKKIVLRASGGLQIMQLASAAKRAGLPHALVRDAGKTQVAVGTVTAVAIGPARSTDVNRVTGALKLW
jgi:peptidyl-tRNA hydrolase, PTH2 family